MNAEARDAILAADIVIYWAGTQHSSLFPSYLTRDLAETITESHASKKILVTNILKDRDIGNETACSLIKKFFWFMSRKSAVSHEAGALVTDMLINQTSAGDDKPYLAQGEEFDDLARDSIRIAEWHDPEGRHDLRKILNIINLQGSACEADRILR